MHETVTISGSDPSGELLEKHGWGDGLPIVPPTPELVEEALAFSKGDPDETIAVLPPRNGNATRRVIAINAVMAGASPETLPVLITAIRALGRQGVNLRGVNATTHPVAPLVVVHGKAVKDMGFNAGLGTFGPGNRSNASLGRAVRFVLLHVAGSSQGDVSTQGQPSKYTYCTAENSDASPWESYPESLGLDMKSSERQSAVTVFCGENPHNFHDMESSTAEPILDKAASVMATLGCNNACISSGEFFVVLCPEHARSIADSGWERRDVREYLFAKARRPAAELRSQFKLRAWEDWMEAVPDGDFLPVTESPENIRIFVAGGAGKHSCVIPSWGMTRSQTLPVLD